MGTSINSSPTPQTKSSAITDAANTNVAAPAGKQTPTPPQKPQEDPQAAANAAKASKQNASDRKGQQDARGQVVQQNLQKQVPSKNKNAGGGQTTKTTTTGTAQKVSNAGAGGQLHHANVARWRGGYLYDFGRPVTKEQAAKFIFEDGKIPKDAKLVQGPGNTWHMQVQGGHDQKIEVYGKMKNPSDLLEYPPLTQYPRRNTKELTWVDGPKEPAKVSEVSRQDLKNNFGFTVTKRYKPDEGQRPTDKLGQPGHAYELTFDKPMTKAQAMDKLIDKSMTKPSEVKLVPIGPEPSRMWQVELIGESAFGFKQELRNAFYDADVHTKDSVPTGTPAGLRSHFENKTIPKDAVKLKDPPNTYVWEQDGHMAYVTKSEDGKLYDFQFTKLPTGQQDLIWMRHYMKEKGMPPREAWQAFWNDTKDIARMQLGAIGGAVRTPGKPSVSPGGRPTVNKSPSTGGRGPTTKPSVKVNTPNVSQKSKTNIGKADTMPAPKNTVDTNPPPAPVRGPQGAPVAEFVIPPLPRRHNPNAPITIKTSKGSEKMTMSEYHRRWHSADQWVSKQAASLSKLADRRELYKKAQEKFGLQENWQFLSNKP